VKISKKELSNIPIDDDYLLPKGWMYDDFFVKVKQSPQKSIVELKHEDITPVTTPMSGKFRASVICPATRVIVQRKGSCNGSVKSNTTLHSLQKAARQYHKKFIINDIRDNNDDNVLGYKDDNNEWVSNQYIPTLTAEQNLRLTMEAKKHPIVAKLISEESYLTDRDVFNFVNKLCSRWGVRENAQEDLPNYKQVIGCFDSIAFQSLFDMWLRGNEVKEYKKTYQHWESLWTTKLKTMMNKRGLLDKEKIIFTICIGQKGHWNIIVVDVLRRETTFIDSLHESVNKNHLCCIQSIIDYGFGRRKYIWKENNICQSPKQNDVINCGVYTCINSLFYLLRQNPIKCYDNSMIVDCRKYIAFSNITKTVYEPHSYTCPACLGWYTKKTVGHFLECYDCKSWTHIDCAGNNNLEEENWCYYCVNCRAFNGM
jgi:hypothetical protein